MKEIRNCKICGRMFVSVNARNVVCERLACKEENTRARARELSQMRREEVQKKRSGSLTEINKKARAAGLSYGMYMARQYH